MSLRPIAHAPGWALGLAAVLFLAAALTALTALGARELPESGEDPADEELVVERTVLGPDTIELTVRNSGSDPVRIAQVFVNDVYVDLVGADVPIDRLATDTIRISYPWRDGQPYLVSLLMGDGSVVEHEISGAGDTPRAGPGLLGWIALLGAFVGIVAALLGMLLLPVLRAPAVRGLLAVTAGLLAFLVFDTTATSVELAERTGTAFGGAALVVLGAAVTYLLLTGVDHWLRRSRQAGFGLALVTAAGIGLQNLCVGLAIGAAYAAGEPAVGVALVVGFALHNIAEGGTVVAPLGDHRPPPQRLLALPLVAGAPAIVGAVLGASVGDGELSAFLLGAGVGTALRAITRLAPRLRERAGGSLAPSTLYGVLAGVLIMYLTGLLVSA